MKMRTFIQIKPAKSGAAVSSHARYMSERERNPSREEPESRPIFTHDRDGLKHTAADRYLSGGAGPRPKPHDLMHVIIGLNAHDQRELKKLERAPEGRTLKSDLLAGRQQSDGSIPDRAEILRAQVERDLPYARAVRLMMENLEERIGRSDFRYALTVHRHTRQTHVHLLLRREHIDKQSGEKVFFDKKGLPEEFVNGRDERGKARGGLIDQSLSDALDTMIPARQRPLAQSLRTLKPSQFDELSPEKIDQLLTIELSFQDPSRKLGQNLGYRNSSTPTSGHEAQMNNGRQRAETPHIHPMPTSSSSPRIELAPRYSTTRRQTDASTPDKQRTLTLHQPQSMFEARVSAPSENWVESQTDQLLVSPVQLLDQKLNFEHFSKTLGGRPNNRVENYFSHASEIETLPPNRPEPEGHAVERRHATLITLDTSLPVPARYSTTRRQPVERGDQPSDASAAHRVIAPGNPAVAAGQPVSQIAEVHNLHSNVHDTVQNVNFEPSRKSSDKHPDKHQENIFSATGDPARQAVDQTSAARSVPLPIKQLVKLERPDLVPLEEKQRSSPTRSR